MRSLLHAPGNPLRPGRTLLPVAACALLLTACFGGDDPQVLAPLPTTPTTVAVDSIAPKATTTTTTTVPADPDDPDVVLIEHGDRGDEVRELQQLLTDAGFQVNLNGLFASTTMVAVKDAQESFGFEPTGKVTRAFLATLERAAQGEVGDTAELASAACIVGVVGDSLVDGSEQVYRDAIDAATGCVTIVDGLSSRTLYDGWQCWVTTDGAQPKLRLVRERTAGADCRAAGLTLLRQWGGRERPLDLVVVALGTNDAVVFDLPTQVKHLDAAAALAPGGRIVVVTSTARPGSGNVALYAAQSAELRRWCAARPGCVVADWETNPAALDPASYIDLVHLGAPAIAARAQLIASTIGPVTPTVPATTTTSAAPAG